MEETDIKNNLKVNMDGEGKDGFTPEGTSGGKKIEKEDGGNFGKCSAITEGGGSVELTGACGLKAVGSDAELVGSIVEINPFGIFPHVVWGNIFNNLKDVPETAWNLIMAYPQLQDEDVINKQEVLFQKVLPFILAELDKKDVLACRRVSKWWRNTVDQFLEGHFSLKPYDPVNGFQKETGFRQQCTLQEKGMKFMVVCRQRNITKMVRDARAAVVNGEYPSIVGKSAIFKLNDPIHLSLASLLAPNPTNMNAFFGSLEPFLRSVGQNINEASFPLCGPFNLLKDFGFYEGLNRCLYILSGLKSLRLTIAMASGFKGPYGNEEKERFAQLMRDQPLPELRELKSLELVGGFYLEAPQIALFTEMLRRYSNQIEHLIVNDVEAEFAARIPLSKVRDIKVHFFLRDTLLDLTNNLLDNLNPEILRKFEIVGTNRVEVPLDGILRKLQDFSLLEIVKLTECEKDIPSVGNDSTIRIPSVRILKVEEHCFPMGIEPFFPLLKCFPNLEYLEFRRGIPKKPKYWQVVRNDESREVTGSVNADIWTLLPKLKNVVIGKKWISREQNPEN